VGKRKYHCQRSGQPAMSRNEENVTEVHQSVCENHWLTVMSIEEQANIDGETMRKILTDNLDMRKVCAEMVPKELADEH
jgi:hypothetical protein